MRNAGTADSWLEENQKYLTAALAEVRQALEERGEPSAVSGQRSATRSQWPSEMPLPALETLCRDFGLSPFERSVLLLCAGMELDSTFPEACAQAQGEPNRRLPTFSLALSRLPDSHWSALAPARPLRYWRLVEVGAGQGLTTSPLSIDERLVGIIEAVSRQRSAVSGQQLAPSHELVADKLAGVWSASQGRDGESSLPVVQLVGRELLGKRAVATAACHRLGLPLFRMAAAALPTAASELETLVRLWEREAVLGAGVLLLECEEPDPTDSARTGAVNHLVERIRAPLLLSWPERRPVQGRSIVYLDVGKPGPAEQRALWQAALGPATAAMNGHLDQVVAQFSFSPAAIGAIGSQLSAISDQRSAQGGQESASGDSHSSLIAHRSSFGDELWELCRQQARPKLDDLAQRIDCAATWSDIVLPEAQLALLRDIGVHVRQRMKVYDTWGFAGKGNRGLGISVLFAGASGTGKTMAAEVLSDELKLDLYRIDLSAVVSKYIGETEKNLRRVFDAAEEGGAILLFDEADALFGKRSEVKDSHDRYANIEVSYLLQRMEAYRGLAILTTNMKQALDTAFLRRIRFVVQFPFPDAAQRAEIWRRIFPSQTPTESLDAARLARLNIAGGNIRNIALYAAFLAAEAKEPVRMTHLLRAARAEYAKLERPLTESEIGGWS
jgi:hypothetical protein